MASRNLGPTLTLTPTLGVIFTFALLCISFGVAQEASQPATVGEVKTSKETQPKAKEASPKKEAVSKSKKPDSKPSTPKLTSEEIRIEMLERLADQLSRRMRALKDRERALDQRERTISEREKEIGALEELLDMREDVIKRREKAPPPQAWNGPSPPSLFSKYAVVLDGKNMQFFHAKAPFTRTPVASTQKLVTALLVCAEGDIDKVITVPREVYDAEPVLLGLKAGSKYSRRELLTALLVKSGNDVAAALAVDNAGSVEAFARKMNRYAKYIGMKDTNFRNPHGLPAYGQYSTAHDIGIAAFEAYQNPEIRKIVKTKSYTFRFNDGRQRILYNTNRVLSSLPGCNGMKTGFTYAAGNCLVSSARINGRDRIAVVLKSSRPYVYNDSIALLRWAASLEMGVSPEGKTNTEAQPEPVKEVAALTR